MSRHHILPPTLSTPEPPKPKETRRRRRVGAVYGKRATDEADETEEASDLANTAPVRNSPLPRHEMPVEAADRRIPRTTGHLSEDTLKALLEAQEDEGG